MATRNRSGVSPEIDDALTARAEAPEQPDATHDGGVVRLQRLHGRHTAHCLAYQRIQPG